MVYFYFYFLSIINYLTPIIINYIFFILISFILVFNNFYTVYRRFFKKTILTLYWVTINFFLFFFTVKFVGNFYISNHSSIIFLANFTGKNINTLNILGDTIIILCILITIISWVLLSERYLNNNHVNVFYFLIFTVLTINMVYTKNILIMFIFFEFIFLPSLFFVYVLGYAKKVEKTIKYLLIWTFVGSFIVLSTIVYTYAIAKSLNLDFLRIFKFSLAEKILIGFFFFYRFWSKNTYLTFSLLINKSTRWSSNRFFNIFKWFFSKNCTLLFYCNI